MLNANAIVIIDLFIVVSFKELIIILTIKLTFPLTFPLTLSDNLHRLSVSRLDSVQTFRQSVKLLAVG